ncbi:DUF2334 domain-containing protein [Massilia arenosa]|uniref:DUF2334 domain-containing protein n=1 Tax=Zemynaea arenosa TaxID=2561931 RepID=A0A4Y9SAY3_9BURK|nr:DUF2334 domain-containing protein [Massilia arenosa]TFW16750.1 DUF2334 domain-containing protein [Massilia arenosa]
MPKFLIRFDDVTPRMRWDAFQPFIDLADELGLHYLVGVVPDCRDTKLNVDDARPQFWAEVRRWKDAGWTIAQHGYTHEYATLDSGLLGINKRSEFADLPYALQLEKLSAGKAILESEGVWEPVFMAPGHSFDDNTLRALANLGFTAVTDGYGCYPYRLRGMLAVPQLFSSPKHFGLGVYTICLHSNNMSIEAVERAIRFIRTQRHRIISFAEASSVRSPFPLIPAVMRHGSEWALRAARALRHIPGKT